MQGSSRTDTPGSDLALEDCDPPREIVLTRGGRVTGIVSELWALGHRDAVRNAKALLDVARHDYVTIPSHAAIFEVLARLHAARASVAIVLQPVHGKSDEDAVLGIVTKAHLAEAVAEGMELFGD